MSEDFKKIEHKIDRIIFICAQLQKENLSLKKKFTPPPYDLLIVDIISTNTLRVGDFTLRVKSESKSVKSSWKINYEVFIEK